MSTVQTGHETFVCHMKSLEGNITPPTTNYGAMIMAAMIRVPEEKIMSQLMDAGGRDAQHPP